MAGNVGTLNVMVGANIGGLQKGLSGAASTVKGFSASIAGGLGSIGGLLAGLGIGAGLQSAAAGMDAILKSSQTLGISTENLVGLKHAAELADVPFETLTKSLFKMEDSLATAAVTGKGPAATALGVLGLKAEELIRMRPDEAFTVIGDALNGVGNAATRNSIAMDIFGKGAAEIGSVLAMGGEGINQATQEAERLNLTFSAIDAERVDAAGDSISKLKSAVTGAFQLFVVELAGGVGTAAETAAFKFADIARSGIAAFKALRDSVAFFIGSWSLQWELIKVNTAILWDTLKAGAVGAFAALIAGAIGVYNNFKNVFGNIAILTKALGVAVVAFFKEGLDPGAFSKAFKDSLAASGGLTAPQDVQKAMGEAFTNGFAGAIDNSLDAKRKRILGDIADARKTFDDIKAEAESTPEVAATAKAALASATVDSTTSAVSDKLANATQFGTSEGAQQVFGAISAKAHSEDKVAKNTEETARNTARIAEKIENLEPADLDVVDSFG